MLRRKKWLARQPHAPADDAIDGVLVPDQPAPDLADMDRLHRVAATDELADALLAIAQLDPESSATRH